MHIVLYQPEIPQNTGCIGRTCVALGAKLWLVQPLGFRIDAECAERFAHRRDEEAWRAKEILEMKRKRDAELAERDGWRD